MLYLYSIYRKGLWGYSVIEIVGSAVMAFALTGGDVWRQSATGFAYSGEWLPLVAYLFLFIPRADQWKTKPDRCDVGS